MHRRPQIVMGAPAADEPLLDTTLAGGFATPPDAEQQPEWRLLPREHQASAAVWLGLTGLVVLSLPLWVPALAGIVGAEIPLAADRAGLSLGLLLTVLMLTGGRWLADRVVVQVLVLEGGRLELGPPRARVSTDIRDLDWSCALGPLLLVKGCWRSSRVGRERTGVHLVADVYDLPLPVLQDRLEGWAPGLMARTPSPASALWTLVRRPPPPVSAGLGLALVVVGAAVWLL